MKISFKRSCSKSCGWFYRIARRYTLIPERKKICKHTRKEHLTPKKDSKGRLFHASTHMCYKKTGRMKKNYFYCIVEFFPAVRNNKYLRKPLWSLHPQWPSGETPAEVVEELKMMLKDVQHYKPLLEKDPYRHEWDHGSIMTTLKDCFKNSNGRKDLVKKLLKEFK
mgnify:CR=1 FL=1